MSTFTLQANSNFAVPYTVPFNGRIRYEVESEYPTTTYVLDQANLMAFRAGQKFTYFGGFQSTNQHRQELTLPWRGMWYLVMVNFNTFPTAVHYNAWS